MMAARHILQTTVLAAAAALAGCASAPADREADEVLLQDPLLSESKVAHQVVPEAFITALTPADNLDSPASWIAPDGSRWLIATAKATHALVVFDGDSGKRLRVVGGKGKALGKLDRPNGISVVDDLVFVVERDNRRVQVFSLPDFKPLAAFGQDELREPYGLWVRKHNGGYEVVVSDNYMSPANKDTPPPLAELGQRFRRYQLQTTGQGWNATLTQSFGDTTEAGAVRIAESVFGDEANARLMIAEEDVAVGTQLREYGMDGRYLGRNVGTGLFKAQAEGMTLLQCADGSGYWIATDQFKDRSVFQVFDRQSLAPVGAFAGRVTANTDGVWLDQHGDARFPGGVFYALHDDQAVAAFDWRDIARTLRLKDCAL
ncbi:phytase [Xanthomonas campestris pv. campestris]|nr:phytase [Xanthomonas campestris]MEB1261197.1 phytase [Xanthomonas campestris pv. campestris]MEB1322310.1 phytase [Xanthomonas campestris pv. campestris]MEB1357091.1 phytase [Xanthomonas campestris pv. campestris]MEB1421656.1 phytase [Xanthomonas campestris pv. campestris]MEB1445269.1 phytase [Xanthomonas campestris pv. campestris]